MNLVDGNTVTVTGFGILPIISTVIECDEMALTVPITFFAALSALLTTASISVASRNISALVFTFFSCP
jgi:hypothetical protein